MSDLVTRLRDRAYSGKVPDALCEEAAAEIERLRSRPCPYVTGTVTQHCTLTPFTLTEDEHQAIWLSANRAESLGLQEDAAVLRGLLGRLK
jgi:hypothetical protein